MKRQRLGWTEKKKDFIIKSGKKTGKILFKSHYLVYHRSIIKYFLNNLMI